MAHANFMIKFHKQFQGDPPQKAMVDWYMKSHVFEIFKMRCVKRIGIFKKYLIIQFSGLLLTSPLTISKFKKLTDL